MLIGVKLKQARAVEVEAGGEGERRPEVTNFRSNLFASSTKGKGVEILFAFFRPGSDLPNLLLFIAQI